MKTRGYITIAVGDSFRYLAKNLVRSYKLNTSCEHPFCYYYIPHYSTISLYYAADISPPIHSYQLVSQPIAKPL